jgi:hypothetical protein
LAGNNRLNSHLGSNASPIRTAPGTLDDQPVIAVAVVAVEKIVLVIQIRDQQVEKSIVVVISPSASISNGAVVSKAAGGNFREGPIAIIVIKEIVLARAIGRPVGDKQVKESIVVVVSPGGASRIAHVIRDRAGRYFREGAIAVVVVEKILLVRIGDEEIEKTVVVVVAPGATERTATIRHNSSGRYFGERAVPIVMIEKVVFVVIRHEEIEKTVVVVIAPRAACRVATVCDNSSGSDSGKRAVTVVME